MWEVGKEEKFEAWGEGRGRILRDRGRDGRGTIKLGEMHKKEERKKERKPKTLNGKEVVDV